MLVLFVAFLKLPPVYPLHCVYSWHPAMTVSSMPRVSPHLRRNPKPWLSQPSNCKWCVQASCNRQFKLILLTISFLGVGSASSLL